MKIKNGKDYKAVEKIDGLYGVYGTGGLISRTDYYLINKPTVCIGRKGTIDKPLYFDQPIWAVDTLFYSDIFREYFPLFIYYLFLTVKWQNYNQSTGVPSLTSSAIEQIRIYIPYSKKEQEKIASLLFCLDKKIKIITSKTQALKKYKRGLIKIISENGKTFLLNDILNEENSRTKTSNECPILSSTSKGIFLQNDYFNHQVASTDNIGYKIMKMNQIVFSPQNLWLGNINLNDKFEIGAVSPSYKIYSLNLNLVDPHYIIEYLKTPYMLYKYKLCSEQGASIVRRNLDINSFLNIKIKLPDLKSQRTIKALHQHILNLENLLLTINKLKKYLLNSMFI